MESLASMSSRQSFVIYQLSFINHHSPSTFPPPPFRVTMVSMSRTEKHPLIAGTVVTSLGTLASRLLGLFREMVTSWLFGVVGKGVADAFLFAFRVPNLFRQLFGEGALTASYLPVLTDHLEADPLAARHLSSVVVSLLAALLAMLAAAGELLLGLIWLIWGDAPGVGLLVGLSAIMLPYVVLICVAAQLSTMLYAAQHFTVPALAPTMLNIVWLLAAGIGYVCFPHNQVAQAYVLAVGVIVSGVAQVAVHLPTLHRLGYRFDYNWSAARAGVAEIGRKMAPTFIGLAILQINTFVNCLIAWGLAAAKDGPHRISWLGGAVKYPMEQGAVASLYYADRLCDVPLGIVGLPVAVAIFPLLCRHVTRGDHRQFGEDMTLGLRFVLCLSVPASVGLMLLGQPITRLLLQHGHFRPEDTVRVAWVINCYAAGVWANCAWPVLVRGFYALGDMATPVRVGASVVGLNLILNLTLIWPLAEAGLAISTTVATVVQLSVLMALFSRHQVSLDWRQLSATVLRTILAAAVMAAVICSLRAYVPGSGSLTSQAIQVGAPLFLGAAAYCGAYLLLGGRELGMLWSGRADD
jgi:putative peptidoglycan lipid II flippase